MTIATHTGVDQNWQDETTVYWFRLDGDDHNSGRAFDGDIYGVSESGTLSRIVDCDGAPLTEGDGEEITARRLCVVTDEMRANT